MKHSITIQRPLFGKSGDFDNNSEVIILGDITHIKTMTTKGSVFSM